MKLISGVMSIVLPACFSWAQIGDPGERPYTLSIHSDLVLLDVGVKDRNGGFISDLTRDNFKVFENGKLQRIAHFSNEDLPLTIGLVIDDSGSMRDKRAEVITAGLAFISGSNPHDELFVTHFNDRVRSGLPEGVPFSNDVLKLRAALMSGVPAGRTALYDAILFSLKRLEAGKQDKKTLVLVSDGGDNASRHRPDEVLRAVRESRVTIYAIGIFDEDDPDRNPGILRSLANISGGEAFFPKQVPEVVEICRQIAKDIRNRYSLAYVPSQTSRTSGLRTIRVAVDGTGQRKPVVHARTSYMLPEEKPIEGPVMRGGK